MKNQNLFIRKIIIAILFMVGFTAAYADFFTIEAINLSFTRDDKGKISGFVFSAVGGRDDKGIAFKRQ